MKITSSDKYILFTAESPFDIFKQNIQKNFSNYADKNIVLDLSNITTTEEEIKSLEEFAAIQIENSHSFAIILPSFNADAFEEELNVVPTLVEAEDIIDMDEMTRDLGF
ncbi:hypothetical protein Q4595_06795 [Wenyingzhuangia sp. 1_MG-2023]|nr:hypothetical protein [Wenyingzhuangia sp. 1_MG-2023]